MIRFIHSADPHLDSPLRGLKVYEGAPVETLRGATRRAFENLIDLAISEKIDFLVIAGDLYDGNWRDYNTGLFFRKQMAVLRQNDIPVYLIAGNHDAESVITRKLRLPDNVHVLSTRSPESKEVPGLPLIIHGRGFPNRSVTENLALEYPPAVDGKFNLGLLHTSLNGRPGHDTYAPCSESDLRSKGYDYWALGHIHQPEIVSKDPWIVYAGNCQGRHIRETGARGGYLVTVDDSLLVESVVFHPLDVVRWLELRIDLSRLDQENRIYDQVRCALTEAVDDAEGRLIAARITLTGTTSLHGILHRESHRISAEVMALAQDFGEGGLWIERTKVATSPVYNPAELAERDPLTRMVLDSIKDPDLSSESLPNDISDMLNVLPSDLRSEVENELKSDGRDELIEEVRAIILEAISLRGGHKG